MKTTQEQEPKKYPPGNEGLCKAAIDMLTQFLSHDPEWYAEHDYNAAFIQAAKYELDRLTEASGDKDKLAVIFGRDQLRSVASPEEPEPDEPEEEDDEDEDEDEDGLLREP